MTLNSESAAQRQKAYDDAVAALHRVAPKIAPVAKPDEAFAIPRVAQQAREAVAPPPPPASPERMLHGRVSNMWNAVAELVAQAKRKGIEVEFPTIKQSDDLGYQLQVLNEAHDRLEKQIEYFDSTTKEQRAIDQLRRQGQRIEKRLDAMAAALTSFSELLSHLMSKEK
jgi:hypothetical protein